MNSPESIELMDKLFFESYRVGVIRQDITEVEPIVRNAEMLAIDISAIRKSDAPGNPNSSANGFYGEELTDRTIDMMQTAAFLHDIGKGAETDSDQNHAEVGAEMARKMGEDSRVVNAIAAYAK